MSDRGHEIDLQIEKERMLHMFESQMAIKEDQSTQILQYWSTKLEMLEELDEIAPLQLMAKEMERDVERLQLLRQEVRLRKEQDQCRESDQILSRLLRLLEDMFERIKKKLWYVRQLYWRQFHAFNPAYPKRNRLDTDKSKPKQDGAQKGVPSEFFEDKKPEAVVEKEMG